LYVSSRCTILFTARLLYQVVFESYKPFNGQGGVTTYAVHCTLGKLKEVTQILHVIEKKTKSKRQLLILLLLRPHFCFPVENTQV